MQSVLLLILTIFLHGCASSVPRHTSNVCMLYEEKEEWRDNVGNAASKWNIPEHTILAIIYHESKFYPYATPPRRPTTGLSFLGSRYSSAYGYAQALRGTWKEYKKRTGNSHANRDNFKYSVDFIGWYLNNSAKRLGISRRNAYHLYLSYHQGISGFRRKSYQKKTAIKAYARKVQKLAVTYRNQLKVCRGLAYK